ncbi:MAG: TlpA family protein disulfide reductase, partial [bacterium]|nr:TlpA family protein disulfide reductase [bacterium]
MKFSRLVVFLWLAAAVLFSFGVLPGAGPIDVKDVKKIGAADLENILTSYKGKVLLLNVWATWCKPCREEFPDLVRLQDFYKGKNIQI